MKKSRFSETQIVAILKEADAGLPVQEVCWKHGISTATYYNWKSKYGGLGGFRAQAHQGARDGECAPEANVCRSVAREPRDEGSDRPKALRPSEKRQAVRYLLDAHCLSITRSCRCVGLTRAAYYREPIAPEVRDAEIIALLNELVEERPRAASGSATP